MKLMDANPIYSASPAEAGLDAALARAAGSPFYRERMAAAGIASGAGLDWDRWRRLPPTTKEEMRELADFYGTFCTPERAQAREYWRSGGVTGRPLLYPQTADDLEDIFDVCEKMQTHLGIGPGDTVMCSFPIGLHPAGQMMIRTAERLGAATVWAGAGSQTPSNFQVDLIHDLGVTVWMGMASYGLHLAHLAEAAGRPLARSRVRILVNAAELVSRSKRALLSELWDASVKDLLGLSELSCIGVQCAENNGFHVWTEHAFCEVLDPQTFETLEPGAAGVLCLTPLTGGRATPFLRFLSGDIVSIEIGCSCGLATPRIVHSGRTTGFFKVAGVNVNHAELEERLYTVPALRDFRVLATPRDRLLVEVEAAPGSEAAVAASVGQMVKATFEVRPQVKVLERGTIARDMESQLKPQRFLDQRRA